MPEARVRGVRLHYEDRGAGLAVVFLHGFPLGSDIWTEVAEVLHRRFRVVAPDLRGHGASEAPAGSYAMDVLAEDVVALADAVGLDRFVLVGHSMGGYVTFRVAARYLDRLVALGLVATRAEPDDDAAKARRHSAVDRVRREGGRAFVDSFVENLVSPHTRAAKPQVLDRLRAVARQVPDHVLVACLEALAARPDSRPLLPSLKLPALVVAGEHDPVTPPESARALAHALPAARLVVVREAGHVPSVEAPEATAAALGDFLAALGA